MLFTKKICEEGSLKEKVFLAAALEYGTPRDLRTSTAVGAKTNPAHPAFVARDTSAVFNLTQLAIEMGLPVDSPIELYGDFYRWYHETGKRRKTHT